ncbi:MAG: tetratricopeptide repeat protein [Pseudomonadota bacterium]
MSAKNRLLRARTAIAAAALLAAGCAGPFDEETQVSDPGADIDVIDSANLGSLMLTLSDPEDAVGYFQQALAREPDRVDLKRGYALSLARARRYPDAVRLFEELEQSGDADDAIRVEHAHALARLERWTEAENQMALVSGAKQSPRRHLIDAMLADHRSDWAGADSAYERARSLSPNPATILNNWGVSRMSRGEYPAAQRTFEEAIAHNPRLFSIKNNLAVSRALQGEYRLPLVTMSEEERATMLHNVGVIALRRGDGEQAKGLFTMAVETHPRYYAAAAEKLAALEANVVN